MQYEFYIVDVFSAVRFSGNQLAVLPNAAGLTAAGMQKIAREFNFAETAFVLPANNKTATARVRIFTPAAEIDFAGHPTVGTACAMVYDGHAQDGVIVLEENIGLVPVDVTRNGDALFGTLTHTSALDCPEIAPPNEDVAAVLGVRESDVVEAFYASVGLGFCFVRLASQEAVDAACLDKSAWSERMADAWSSNMYFFCGDLTHKSDVYARMMAPALGVQEDPATGSAVAALVGVAAARARSDGVFELAVIQGVKLGRPSHITASATMADGQLESVSVGGPTVFTAKGRLDVDREWLEG